MDIKLIGDRIKQARALRNYTLDDIASDIGVAKSTIQRYENGLISNPKLPVLQAIAESLKVNPSWLSGFDVPMIDDTALSSIVSKRLTEIEMSVAQLADKANVPLHWLKSLDTFTPGQFGDYEIGYDWITRVADVIGMQGSILRSALAKQEIPVFESDEPRISAKEAFGSPDIMTYYNRLNNLGKETATEQVRLLTLDNKYTSADVQPFPTAVREPEPDYLKVNAAQTRTDQPVTQEDLDYDENLIQEYFRDKEKSDL